LRNVVVSGGSRGLGLGIGRVLAAAGYHVVAIARSLSADLEAAMEEAEHAGSGAISFRAFDLSDLGSIPELVRGIRKDVGPFYGLVNNAGLGTSGVLATMPDTAIERLVELNTLSPILLTKYVVRSMLANKERGGRVVNISSVVSSTGYSGLSVYSATKASLVGFTRSLAREVGQLGITVNAIAPGFVDTDMTGGLDAEQRERIARRSALRRLIDVDDVARTVGFLLGDDARNITGTVVTVDAGNTA
jgi:3-oxoacyl-[acyl-carrier protein] reductase